jgi:hypothetical protein
MTYQEYQTSHSFTEYSLHSLGNVAEHQGDYVVARARYEESLTIHHALEDRWSIALDLTGLAGERVVAGQPVRAAQLLGAAEALLEFIGVRLEPLTRTAYEHNVAAVRAQLSEEAFAAAWNTGRSLTVEQAIAEAFATIPLLGTAV